MFFMTPMDWAAITMRNAAQFYALQLQMAQSLAAFSRQQGAAFAPMARPAAPAAMGICGPVRLSLVKPTTPAKPAPARAQL
ncbi:MULTISPECIES: hypothetical protein [unclassified Salipiger]|uniref:hypothetical protein n=1 Tax=unclassified Salipiger TaxID=2640570 RepID=UPI00080A9C5F|nr:MULTISPECIES: hypothetical protein [unclassified Salipiger]ANT59620.1 hypothetical protein AYJ57_04110 [Salipiger sp. CCB-MM3]NDW00671.1 hypothetical protein [Salipiger sp. PrR002]NDW57734.1 hypothetical protein [Salipiger sp. PrR004]